MKSLIIIAALVLAGFASQAQDSWKVYLNKQELFSSNKVDEANNKLVISKSQLTKSAEFVLTYVEQQSSKDWKRDIMVFDAADNRVLEKEGMNILKLTGKELAELLDKHKSIRIFTIALPTDPAQAALVRVARVHLVTVELK